MGDLLLHGTLYTLDPRRPRAGAALIRDGKFVRVGSREECEREAEKDALVIATGAGCAVPGLVDAHGHPFLHGRMLAEVRLQGAASAEQCATRVAAYAQTVPAGQWIRGGGWDQNLWPGQAFPDAKPLDAAVPGHPVAVMRADLHAVWCNTRALQAAGIAAGTPDPPGGRILRRPDGTPSGVLVDAAMELVRRAIPAPAGNDMEATILRSLHALAAVGLTGVHDASAGPAVLETYRRLAERRQLPIRVYAMIDGQGEKLPEMMRAWRETPRIGLLTVRSVKLFADGALGSRGAAMFEPYEDDPGNTGLWLTEPRELQARIARVAAAGYQPCVHCIGDRACAVVLRAYLRVPPELRPRAEHLQVLRPEDVPLLHGSRAVASMQPTHATSDGSWAESRLGQGTGRQRGAYAWRQALDAGAILAFGSDFPVEDIDPRQGLRAAIARKLASGKTWMPEQRLRREEALRAFTAGAAFAEFAEEQRGCIREGFDADLTVFGSNLMTLPADELPRAPLAATVVQGRVVYAGE
jgi:predicted amidohydrolase YtcJ